MTTLVRWSLIWVKTTCKSGQEGFKLTVYSRWLLIQDYHYGMFDHIFGMDSPSKNLTNILKYLLHIVVYFSCNFDMNNLTNSSNSPSVIDSIISVQIIVFFLNYLWMAKLWLGENCMMSKVLGPLITMVYRHFHYW